MPDVQAFIIYGHPDHIVTPLSLKLLPKHEWDTSIAALEPGRCRTRKLNGHICNDRYILNPDTT